MAGPGGQEKAKPFLLPPCHLSLAADEAMGCIVKIERTLHAMMQRSPTNSGAHYEPKATRAPPIDHTSRRLEQHLRISRLRRSPVRPRTPVRSQLPKPSHAAPDIQPQELRTHGQSCHNCPLCPVRSEISRARFLPRLSDDRHRRREHDTAYPHDEH